MSQEVGRIDRRQRTRRQMLAGGIAAVAVIAAGVFTGILAGVFGVGGGGVVVPVLFEVFGMLGVPDDVRMQLCIGTSLAASRSR